MRRQRVQQGAPGGDASKRLSRTHARSRSWPTGCRTGKGRNWLWTPLSSRLPLALETRGQGRHGAVPGSRRRRARKTPPDLPNHPHCLLSPLIARGPVPSSSSRLRQICISCWRMRWEASVPISCLEPQLALHRGKRPYAGGKMCKKKCDLLPAAIGLCPLVLAVQLSQVDRHPRRVWRVPGQME